MKISAKIQAELDRMHTMYSCYNQSAGEGDLLMVELKHPFADDFKMLRAVFDQLLYASNSHTRLIAYGKNERAEYSAPSLDIEVSHMGEKFASFWGAYPGTDWNRYVEYVEAAAESGWHPDCKASIDLGGFRIKTKSVKLAGDIYAITKGRVAIPAIDEDGIININVSQYSLENASQVLLIFAAIRRRMKCLLIPLRTAADNFIDSLPLELPQKHFQLANVTEVTVTDHAVLVPLVPLNNTTQELVLRITTKLLELCRGGYPYKGSVRGWLAQFLKASAIKRFDREFVKAQKTA